MAASRNLASPEEGSSQLAAAELHRAPGFRWPWFRLFLVAALFVAFRILTPPLHVGNSLEARGTGGPGFLKFSGTQSVARS